MAMDKSPLYCAQNVNRSVSAKPKLLVLELWALGDLAIATPFLQAAEKQFDVTLLAKPHALELQKRFWPGIKTIPFTAPWTAFNGKYLFHKWPWRELSSLRKNLSAQRFEFGLSARHDPRDHFLLFGARVKQRLGFPRTGSRIFLTKPLVHPAPTQHRYENWRVAGCALGIDLPKKNEISLPPSKPDGVVLIHTGAAKTAKLWPLEKYRSLLSKLRQHHYRVEMACDPQQRDWWLHAGENEVQTPRNISELLEVIDRAAVFIGNDSGPGHLAALTGAPTFTLFGPAVPEWFVPMHPAAEFIPGKPCPYWPCNDYCHFPTPHCIWNHTEEEVWARVEIFLSANLKRNKL